LAKKGGVPPGLAKKGYRPVGWAYGAPPWYGHSHYGSGPAYRPPYGVYRNTCYREDLGQALGAVAGGVAGYQVGSGHGKVAAVIGGTIIGALIGGHIGRSMDDVDQNCIGQILEHAPPNQPVTWHDPAPGPLLPRIPDNRDHRWGAAAGLWYGMPPTGRIMADRQVMHCLRTRKTDGVRRV
jgi:hypothetical protein